MVRFLGGLVALGLGALAAFWLVTRPQLVPEAELAGLSGDAQAGAAIFWAGGCASCHAPEEAEGDARLVLSGGAGLVSDFGTFYPPNISPDPTQGIGAWTLAQFVTAMQNGISPEGRHYYPAFPYPAYRLATRRDMADLFAFLQTLPASDAPSPAHEVGFPFSIRRAVGAWNLLYLSDEFAVADAGLSEAQHRGRYLAEALAHCGECHTPRDALGGPDRARWLAGAPNPTGSGRIPSLTPDDLTWSQDEIAAYLNDGFTPEFDSAGGHMRSVILNLANLTGADRAAIAAYLDAVPPAAD
ncbi:Putative diheme cytochrome c-553 [Roseibacterium elongatum DSM 19469]|uniref:Putative diheme cytochrome c-553 n=1 Tax=Roseicyclus elongatus DSM 19469 TaxID=1294273 RepID=W8RVD6_9RHOB|nr:cytochrome c [Roseibacterium elongatum]AHM05174.1 Putative diheme cytochrome c-553 [Roseibacterium elongatum DSM 19469]